MAIHAFAPCVLAAVTGHASWIFYFHRFETHMYAVLYINTFLASCAAGLLYLTKVCGYDLGYSASLTTAVAASYLAGVYGSLITWRAFFNPLNKLPGPWPARLGGLYFSTTVTKSDAYHQLRALHEKYGRIVRIGPNDLSITDPNIMEKANGRKSEVTKGPWYDGDYPLSSMHTTRNKALHDTRRKVWGPAFSDKAVKDYETRILALEELLVHQIEERKGKPTDITVYFNLFAFDAMALLAFGKNYGMLEKGEKHWALDLLSEGMQPFGYWLPVWLFRLLTAIPGLAGGFHKFIQFCVDELTWRINNAEEAESGKGSDIMSQVLEAYKGIAKPEEDPLLRADARLIIVAGSDTTAAALTYLFYHLAQQPDQVKKLREELTPLMSGDWSDHNIHQAQHLNACIYEALRMHPPVPSGVQRMLPPQGMEVDGQHIPGNTIFWMPQYVMGRDKDVYPDADSFVPERWYSKPEMVKNKDAWAPFSMGTYGCIGKNLAMMELRTVTARLISKFDLSLAPGEDGHRLEYQTKDHFTVDPGSLDVIFKKI